MAPETLDDQRLKDIIKNNKNDHDAIVLAIEHIWHGMLLSLSYRTSVLKLPRAKLTP